MFESYVHYIYSDLSSLNCILKRVYFEGTIYKIRGLVLMGNRSKVRKNIVVVENMFEGYVLYIYSHFITIFPINGMNFILLDGL